MENTLRRTDSLTDLKSKLKIRFPSLSDSDLNFEAGKKTEVLSNLRVKLGKTREEWDDIMTTFNHN